MYIILKVKAVELVVVAFVVLVIAVVAAAICRLNRVGFSVMNSTPFGDLLYPHIFRIRQLDAIIIQHRPIEIEKKFQRVTRGHTQISELYDSFG